MKDVYRYPGIELVQAVLCAAQVSGSLCMRPKEHPGGHLPLPSRMPSTGVRS